MFLTLLSRSRVLVLVLWLTLFFFKQKTAYEMRISDWSSDVCSSDLPVKRTYFRHARASPRIRAASHCRGIASGGCRGAERRGDRGKRTGDDLVCDAACGPARARPDDPANRYRLAGPHRR